MIEHAGRVFFNLLAQSRALKKLASRYGTRRPTSFARRFIAGETIPDAIQAAQALHARGLTHTLDLLGERATSLHRADEATREYLRVVDAISGAGIDRNISLKLTQLGLDIDKACTIDNLRKILERAESAGFFVRIDMENSPYTAATLDVFKTLWTLGHRQIGVVLQASLYRSEGDLEEINALGARVRLVKGAYQEPKSVAYQKKADVDASFARMIQVLFRSGHYPAIATHDPKMIDLSLQLAREHRLGTDGFEFQMLYGVRRDLQSKLANKGYRVRIYLPFGREWFPYFMRRLGERPANVMFVIRGIVRETR
ncbi:MAG TPA: proline dehydrogenase family protein [Vicinamibacterales bacterium]|jgi:proline dehydrogenase|nr:proline dehydrogenase family protein [Vicinamibacterales bacterium]